MRQLNFIVFVVFLSQFLVATFSIPQANPNNPATDVIPLDEESWTEVLEKEWLIQL